MKRILAAVIAVTLMITISSCGWRSVRGNGNVTTSTRNEANFEGVKTAGSFDLYINQGDTYEIKIEAEENLMKYILTNVEDGVLKVRVKKGISLRPKLDMKVYVTAPNFKVLGIAGSGNIVAETKITTTNTIDFSVAGSGNIKVPDVDAPSIKMRISGSGNVDAGGQAKDVEYKIAGSGDVFCEGLKAENAKVSIAGSGSVKLYCSQNLEVNIAGGGDVYYFGNPVNVKQKIAGSGNLVKQ